LPHRNIAAAVKLALGADVPFLPTLPRLAATERIDRQGLTPAHFAVWDRWFSAASLRTKFPRLKIQLPGPSTAAADIWKNGAKDLLALAQSRTRELLLVLDEPCWTGLRGAKLSAEAARLRQTLRKLRAPHRRLGVHCCGETDWARLLATRPDVVSFDAALSWPLIVSAAASTFLPGGGRLIVGLPLRWLAQPTRAAQRLVETVPVEALRACRGRLDWSTACGLAGVSTGAAKSAQTRVLAVATQFERQLNAALASSSRASR